MTPLISVLLPTVRPHLLPRCLASIAPACGEVPFEIIVVADFPRPADLPDCHWIVRDRRGVIDAVTVAEAMARGTYRFLFNDESVLGVNALARLYQEALRDPLVLLTPRHEPAFNFSYYGRPFAPFPFAHKSVLRHLGGLLDPIYRGFYADPDLSLRAHAAGVPVRVLDEAVIYHDNCHDEAHGQAVRAYVAADREIFGRRWAHLGELVDP